MMLEHRNARHCNMLHHALHHAAASCITLYRGGFPPVTSPSHDFVPDELKNLFLSVFCGGPFSPFV